jgi:hypothetical protein
MNRDLHRDPLKPHPTIRADRPAAALIAAASVAAHRRPADLESGDAVKKPFAKHDVTLSERNKDPAGMDGSGYAASGESAFSRRISSGGPAGKAISTTDLEADLHRARVRASHHPERLIRRRAGEDARRLEAILKRSGVDVSGRYEGKR